MQHVCTYCQRINQNPYRLKVWTRTRPAGSDRVFKPDPYGFASTRNG